jgi:thioredoxin reductase (NADPH)
VEEAEYLTRYASKVYLIHRRDELRASKVLQERLFANPKIEIIWNRQVLEIEGREEAGMREVTGLRLKDTVTGAESKLAAAACFVFIGFQPNTGLIREHFRHDASGYVITDDRMMTSVPGLFAAGDLRAQLTRQVTTAVGDATTAAIAVEKYLADRRSRVRVGA